MSCDPVRVTGYVDGALPAAERVELETHLAGCEACRVQAEDERTLRSRLASLPHVTVPDGLAGAVLAQLRRPERAPRWPWVAAMAAGVILALFWVRGTPGLVAREIAWDHDHCFSRPKLPAKVWGSDPATIERWFAEQGTRLPAVPESAGGLTLVGARTCHVMDRSFAHLYYSAGDHRLSLHVVPGTVRLAGPQRRTTGGKTIELMRTEGITIGLTSEDPDIVDAFVRALSVRTAANDEAPRRVLGGVPAVWPGLTLVPGR